MTTQKYRKKQRNTRKKRGGYNVDQVILLQYLNSLKTKDVMDCGITPAQCKTPESKSAQKISICPDNVFKGPKPGFSPTISVNTKENFIQVDPHTMNLLVQTAIKNLEEKPIEQYKNVCKAKDYSYAMKGSIYQFPLNVSCSRNNPVCKDTTARSVEDYIKIMNEELDTLEKDGTKEKLNNKRREISTQIIIWMKSIVESLDFLFEKIQFHHCDPKAAQLFLNDNQVIVGDLDKVTFSLNIRNEGRNTRYRICLGGLAASSAAAATGSIPEKMRFEKKPRATNSYEKAAFMASILLLLNPVVKQMVWIQMSKEEQLKDLTLLINWNLLLSKFQTNRVFKSRAGHKIASECVYTNSTYLHSGFTINDGSISNENPLVM